MMVSTKGRYALRVMIDLAQHQGEGFISLKAIAERQKVSMKYLEMIVSVLNKAGLVKSMRGAAGGYMLTRPAEEYSVSEIMQLTEGTMAPVACLEHSGCTCERASSCLTLPMWRRLDEVVGGYLSSVSIADLVSGTVK